MNVTCIRTETPNAQRRARAWCEDHPPYGATPRGRDQAPRARVIGRDDAGFPLLLRQVPQAPERLFVWGRLRPADALAVAVVGSRQATPYGIEVAERLAFDLAARGVTVVSGLARGIDSAAHRGALEAGGRTLAVLGSGLGAIYPPENRRLAARIADSGAVLSQFAHDARALPYHFPERNRVIAGLALAVVVVEAAERSGALITAGLAADLGREVMAVPGRVTSPASRGAHGLLRDGAALVQGWEDVVAALPRPFRECVGPAPASPAQASAAAGPAGEAGRILALLGDGAMGIDEVIARSGLGAGRVATILTSLEIDGWVRQLPGKRFVRAGRA